MQKLEAIALNISFREIAPTMSAALKLWTILFAVVPLLRLSRTIKTGEFRVVVESVDNHLELSREFADWHFALRRVNKTVKVIDGQFIVKKDVVRPTVRGETYLFTMNKFVKINVNGPTQGNCEELTSFFETYFDGNVTWTDDCVIQPGHMATRRETPINLDEIAHTMYSKAFYRTFKMIVTMYDDANDVIMKVSWVLSTKEKE